MCYRHYCLLSSTAFDVIGRRWLGLGLAFDVTVRGRWWVAVERHCVITEMNRKVGIMLAHCYILRWTSTVPLSWLHHEGRRFWSDRITFLTACTTLWNKIVDDNIAAHRKPPKALHMTLTAIRKPEARRRSFITHIIANRKPNVLSPNATTSRWMSREDIGSFLSRQSNNSAFVNFENSCEW